MTIINTLVQANKKINTDIRNNFECTQNWN